MHDKKMGESSPILPPRILYTKEYSKFFILAENRFIRQSHVDLLIQSIKKKNYLHNEPIKVASNYEIIDGQHRFKAAKALNTWIYYIIVDDDVDFILLNNHRRNWKNDDHLHYFSAKGLPHYIYLKNFCEKFNIPVINARSLVTGTLSGRKKNPFNFGRFHCPMNKEIDDRLGEFYQQIKKINKDKKIKPTSILISEKSCALYNRLLTSGKIEMDTFLYKIETHCNELRQYSKLEDFLNMFLEIYNKYKKNKISPPDILYKKYEF